VEITSRDEFGALGEHFNRMADELSVLMQEKGTKLLLEKELEVASAVQSTLVPDSSEVDLKGLSLAGYFKPTASVRRRLVGLRHADDGRVLVNHRDANRPRRYVGHDLTGRRQGRRHCHQGHRGSAIKLPTAAQGD